MKAVELRQLLNRNAVLLALHALSDDGGVVCYATNKAVAEASGKSAGAVSAAVRDLQVDGSVVMFDWRDGMALRVLVLMDHPEARKYVRHIRKAYQLAGVRHSVRSKGM